MASHGVSVMTVGIAPTIEFGPITLAWNGLESGRLATRLSGSS